MKKTMPALISKSDILVVKVIQDKISQLYNNIRQ